MLSRSKYLLKPYSLIMKVVAIIDSSWNIDVNFPGGFSFSQDKKLVDLGPLEINKKEKKSVGWPIYAGGLALVAGIVVMVADKKKR